MAGRGFAGNGYTVCGIVGGQILHAPPKPIKVGQQSNLLSSKAGLDDYQFVFWFFFVGGGGGGEGKGLEMY